MYKIVNFHLRLYRFSFLVRRWNFSICILMGSCSDMLYYSKLMDYNRNSILHLWSSCCNLTLRLRMIYKHYHCWQLSELLGKTRDIGLSIEQVELSKISNSLNSSKLYNYFGSSCIGHLLRTVLQDKLLHINYY